jgi:hypothetical protein
MVHEVNKTNSGYIITMFYIQSTDVSLPCWPFDMSATSSPTKQNYSSLASTETI